MDLSDEFKRSLVRKIFILQHQSFDSLHKRTWITLLIYDSDVPDDELIRFLNFHVREIILVKAVRQQLHLPVAKDLKTSYIEWCDRDDLICIFQNLLLKSLM